MTTLGRDDIGDGRGDGYEDDRVEYSRGSERTVCKGMDCITCLMEIAGPHEVRKTRGMSWGRHMGAIFRIEI